MNASRQSLIDHLEHLRCQVLEVSDSLRPDALTAYSLRSRLKRIGRKNVLLAILISFAFAVATTHLSLNVYPDKSVALSLATFSFTSFASWFFIFYRQPKEKSRLIQSHQDAVEAWEKAALGQEEYESPRIAILNACCHIITVNNYYALKEIVLDNHLRDDPHFITVREMIDQHFMAACHERNLVEALMACIRVVSKNVINNESNTWLNRHHGAVNLILRKDMAETLEEFDAVINLLVLGYQKVTHEHQTNASGTDASNQQAGVIDFLAIKREMGHSGAMTPAQVNYIELGRLFGLLADIMDPIINRVRLLSAGDIDPGTSALIAESNKKLRALYEDVVLACRAIEAMPSIQRTSQADD